MPPPPVTPTGPGWAYDNHMWRYYDGEQWTRHTSHTDPAKEPSFEHGRSLQPASGTVAPKEYPAGWYSDPWAPDSPVQSRYWDGQKWTSHVNTQHVTGQTSEAATIGEQLHAVGATEQLVARRFPLAVLAFLIFILIVALGLLLLPRLRGTETAVTAATPAPTVAAAAPAETSVLPPPTAQPGIAAAPTVDAGPSEAPSTEGACVETNYEGVVVRAEADGFELGYGEIENTITARLGADCEMGFSIYWVAETFPGGAGEKPLCYAVLGGGSGTVEAGVFSGGHTANVGNFTPAPGQAEQTCRALVDAGNIGQYLGQRGWDNIGGLANDQIFELYFTTDPDKGSPVMALEIGFSPIRS